MAGKKAKVKAKVESEVLTGAPDDEAEPAPAPAIVTEEPIYKVVEKGQAKMYTKSEYDKKYGKKAE